MRISRMIGSVVVCAMLGLSLGGCVRQPDARLMSPTPTDKHQATPIQSGTDPATTSASTAGLDSSPTWEPEENLIVSKTFDLTFEGPRYIVKLYSSPDNELSEKGFIDIFHEGELIQRIEAEAQIFQTREGEEFNQDFLVFEDMDFDGYTDFRILYSAGVVNRFYLFFLWNPETMQFEQRESFKQITAFPYFNREFRQIQGFERNGWGNYVHMTYMCVEGEVFPVLRMEQAHMDGYFVHTISVYVDGEEVVIRQWEQENTGE